MTPTMNLRFVKRRVGLNTVRILQQQFLGDTGEAVWKDVELADDRATARVLPKAGD